MLGEEREIGQVDLAVEVVVAGEGRADQDGRFTFRTLRPGNYYVAAVETIEPGQWLDPDYLAAIRTSAVSVSVLEGETKTVALKLLTVQ